MARLVERGVASSRLIYCRLVERSGSVARALAGRVSTLRLVYCILSGHVKGN